jgi:hypothetical protein
MTLSNRRRFGQSARELSILSQILQEISRKMLALENLAKRFSLVLATGIFGGYSNSGWEGFAR